MLPFHMERKGTPLPTSWPWVRPVAGRQGGCVIWDRAVVSAALADKGVYLDGATHLFLPFVTHSSATRQRSEMLSDRPSPVVPFTVPNRESVRGTSRYLSLPQHQRWKCRGRKPCSRGRDTETDPRTESGASGVTPCFHFSLQTQSFVHLHLIKRTGKVRHDL